jgi:integrase-like protein
MLSRRYMREHETRNARGGRRSRSTREAQRQLDNDILPRIGRIRTEAVSRLHVMQVVEAIADRASYVAADRALGLIRAIYNWACGTGRTDCDPWNEVDHMFSRGETEAIYLNRAVRELKQLARRLQIILVIVVHPHVAGGQKHIEEASLYDVNGGAVWKNKADHGIICWRETPTAATTVIKVDKSKNHDLLGRPGAFKMQFRPALATYEWSGVYSKL